MTTVGRIERPRAGPGLAVVASITLWAVVSCSDRSPVSGADPSRVASGTPSVGASFEGTVQCQPGEEDGAAFWEYGANPRGTIADPTTWTRRNAVGLDPSLSLSFEEEAGGNVELREDVVLARNEDGAVVAFVEFGRDAEGRYFPNYAEMCASAGIEEFS
jgi:hypothetical protein